uniref:Receptor-like serine/threonine-protein kinase n=1 Tax=Salix viminalis TaxID=40686 RepID=A0A6N2KY96_SALVM
MLLSIFSKLMATSVFLLFLPLIFFSSSSSSTVDRSSRASSLSVEHADDVLTSRNGIFSSGFFPVGDNAYCFAVWFSEPDSEGNRTIVWMANRDQPVNGRKSELSVLKSGNTLFQNPLCFSKLDEYGNLILQNSEVVLWQSFDSPTDTLLPQQLLTTDMKLVSSRSQGNFSSGFYKLYFGDDNVLRLLYGGPEISVYWPDPELKSCEAGRSTYNSSRIAFLDPLGYFSSSDNFNFTSADYGERVQRILKLDFDGNIRLYSRNSGMEKWTVSWQAMSQPCRIHGTCGPNSICSYVAHLGRKCSCLQGFKIRDRTDLSLGCVQEFNLTCTRNETGFLKLSHVEFFGYDYGFFPNYTIEMCENLCLQTCDCKGFQFKFVKHNHPDNIPYCYLKIQLLNGHHSPNFQGDLYLKVPKKTLPFQETGLDCSSTVVKQMKRTYTKNPENASQKFVVRFAIVFGAVELGVIFVVGCCFLRAHQNSSAGTHSYYRMVTGFGKFTLSELKKATRGFSEEIGRGAGGVVYKGVLSDHRIAAIKRLNDASDQGEAEFQAEVSTIGKLNHINLTEMWGYCAEGKHRLLVYRYMEHGSLAEQLSSNALSWEKRFEIAVGTAKGLAYLHEECLEWVLHCDVKPQNILLDSNYQPKVSDFGLSWPLKRGGPANKSFSKMRGTRGYMAPEWVSNLTITSKVDVYSYGMVLLEMISGKGPTEEIENRRVVRWVREKMKQATGMSSWIEMIMDPKLDGKYDKFRVEILFEVALKCVAEDKDARPTMKK